LHIKTAIKLNDFQGRTQWDLIISMLTDGQSLQLAKAQLMQRNLSMPWVLQFKVYLCKHQTSEVNARFRIVLAITFYI